LKEFLHRVAFLDIQSHIIHPQSGDDQDPTGNLPFLINILALINISEKLNGLAARIVHTQHDEIIIEAGDAIEDQVEVIAKESMED
jgi:hypothetical protein